MPVPIPADAVEESRRRIVLVSGDAAVRGALSFSLELDGFSVEAFADAQAATTAILPRSGCLVVDQELPGGSGLDLIAALRRRPVTLPAVLLATKPDARTRRRAARAGVAIVETPILGEALVERVRAALGLFA